MPTTQPVRPGNPPPAKPAWIGAFAPGAGPRYIQIAGFLEMAMADGRLVPGDRLPPQRELAALFAVDLTTVTRALAEARRPEFRTYAQAVADNAQSLADGFVKRDAALVTGGTDNHLVLLDVTSFGLTGRQAESALLDSGIVTNRNAIPADPNGAWYTSGIRFGTPALTTRGFGADDFDRVAELVVEVLKNTQPAAGPNGPSKAKYTLADGTADRVRSAAAELLEANPLYPGLTL